MVTITNFFVRQNKDGKPFISLELSGDIEMIQSATSGRFYMTAKRCNVPCTFPEEVAKLMIGKTLRGRIDRVQAEAYEYTVKETGEVITLAHTYVYVPEERLATMVTAPSNVLMAQ
jgi:hypothetical protein